MASRPRISVNGPRSDGRGAAPGLRQRRRRPAPTAADSASSSAPCAPSGRDDLGLDGRRVDGVPDAVRGRRARAGRAGPAGRRPRSSSASLGDPRVVGLDAHRRRRCPRTAPWRAPRRRHAPPGRSAAPTSPSAAPDSDHGTSRDAARPGPHAAAPVRASSSGRCVASARLRRPGGPCRPSSSVQARPGSSSPNFSNHSCDLRAARPSTPRRRPRSAASSCSRRHVEPVDVERAGRRHVADRGLDRGGLALDALDDPLEHAAVLAEARATGSRRRRRDGTS